MGEITKHAGKCLKTFFCLVFAFSLSAAPVSASGSLRFSEVSDSVDGPALKCRASYPHIDGMCNTAVQERFNVLMMERAKAMELRAQYNAKFGNVAADMSYNVTRNNNSVASLVLRDKIGTGKGESCSQMGFTLDTVTGQRYFLSDIFIDNADYVETLSEQIKAQIKSKGLYRKQIREFKRISQNQDYYLTQDSLVLFFEQGEYFSSDCAVREFAIPLKTLAGILKPKIYSL